MIIPNLSQLPLLIWSTGADPDQPVPYDQSDLHYLLMFFDPIDYKCFKAYYSPFRVTKAKGIISGCGAYEDQW